MLAYLVIFLGGIAVSLHCVGMCGAFPLALAGAGPSRPVLRQPPVADVIRTAGNGVPIPSQRSERATRSRRESVLFLVARNPLWLDSKEHTP